MFLADITFEQPAPFYRVAVSQSGLYSKYGNILSEFGNRWLQTVGVTMPPHPHWLDLPTLDMVTDIHEARAPFSEQVTVGQPLNFALAWAEFLGGVSLT